MTDRVLGQRFTLAYTTQGDPKNDSEEMRYRLGKLLQKKKYHITYRKTGYIERNGSLFASSDLPLKNAIEEELGIRYLIIRHSQVLDSWPHFFENIKPNKLLDAITVLHRVMLANGKAGDFISEVNRIFREENIAYEVDDEGGVHPFIDGTFQVTKQSAIRGMSVSRYALSLSRIEEIDAHLMAETPNYIQAIRAVFGANENLFKLMFSAHRLDKKSASDKIGRQLQSIYDGHQTMQRTSAQILSSFIGWIEAAHHYRHEEGAEEPSQPAEEIAVIMISEGMSFVRWLVAIDKKMIKVDAWLRGNLPRPSQEPL